MCSDMFISIIPSVPSPTHHSNHALTSSSFHDEPTTTAPPIAALPTLPIEILEAVVDHAREDQATLHALSTTCRDLLPRARKHLFRMLSSTLECPIQQDAVTVATPYLRHLRINMPSTDNDTICLDRRRVISSIQAVRTVLSSPLPRLSVLEIGTNTGSFSRPVDTRGSASESSSLTIHPRIRTSLRVLDIADPAEILDTPLQVMRFIAQFEGLERLLVQHTRMEYVPWLDATEFYHGHTSCLSSLVTRVPSDLLGMPRPPNSLNSVWISFKGSRRVGGDGADNGQDDGVSNILGFGWTMLSWLRLSPEVALERLEVLDAMRERELQSFVDFLRSPAASKLKIVAFSFARKASQRVQEALVSGWCPSSGSYTISLPVLRRFCISGLFIGPRSNFYPSPPPVEGGEDWNPNDFLPHLVSGVCFSRLATSFQAGKLGQPECCVDTRYDPGHLYDEQDGKEDIDDEESTGKVRFGICITVDVVVDRGAAAAPCAPKQEEGEQAGPVVDAGDEVELWPTIRNHLDSPILDLPWDALCKVLMTYDPVPVRFLIRPNGYMSSNDVFAYDIPGEREKRDRWMGKVLEYFWNGLGEEVYHRRTGAVWLTVV